MNLFDYPKQYFDIFFKGKHPKKFDFTENLIEFAGVLVFLALLQGIVAYLTNQVQEEMISILFTSALISLATVIILAVGVKIVFHFFKGKAKFQEIIALFCKYAAGITFWSGLAAVIVALLAFTLQESTILSFLGMIFVVLIMYLVISIFPTMIGKISKLEKIKQPKADMIFAFAIGLFFVLLIVVSMYIGMDSGVLTEAGLNAV